MTTVLLESRFLLRSSHAASESPNSDCVAVRSHCRLSLGHRRDKARGARRNLPHGGKAFPLRTGTRRALHYASWREGLRARCVGTVLSAEFGGVDFGASCCYQPR